jgi:hypothetical protein
MEKQNFKITIDAKPEKVWDALWNEKTYQEWTAVFSEGSRVETDWKKGSKVFFLDGKGDGMVSMIAENVPNSYMSFKHLGTIIKGKEDLDSKEVESWSGAEENYTLKSVDGKTELSVDMDITDDHKDFFLKTWPRALDKLKALSERNN